MIAWTTKRIDQLGRVVTGKTPSSERPEEFGAEFPFVTPSDIPSTQKHVRTERFLSARGMQAHRRIQLPNKSVCVVCIGATIGKVCMTGGISLSNQQINSIIPTEGELDPDFVYYLSTTLKDSLVAFAGGAATPIINKSAFSSIKLLVPEFPTQRKIAAILSAYDELIENSQRRIALLEQLAEDIYREWFVRLRFPNHDKTKFYKGLPADWSVSRVGDRFATFLGGTPSRDEPAYWGGNIPWINSGEVNKIRILEESEFITERGLQYSAAKVMPKRTTVIAITGATLGQVSLTEIEVCANQSVVGVHDPSGILNEYVFQFLTTNIENLIAKQSGGGQQHINKDIVEKENFLLPTEALMNNYSAIIRPVFDHIRELLFAEKLLIQTRAMLLPRLISGKLSVENLDIQFPSAMAEELNNQTTAAADA